MSIADSAEKGTYCALRILLRTQALTVNDKIKQMVALTPTQTNSKPI